MRLYFDARFGLEFESGDHRAGIDLGDVTADIELHALLFDSASALFQFGLIHLLATLGVAEQRWRRQSVIGLAESNLWL